MERDGLYLNMHFGRDLFQESTKFPGFTFFTIEVEV